MKSVSDPRFVFKLTFVQNRGCSVACKGRSKMSRYLVEVIYTKYFLCEASKPTEFNLKLSVLFDLNFGTTDRHA